MKRRSSPSSLPSKKLKTSSSVSDSEEVPPEELPADARWEKVERRKSKKQRKINAKLDTNPPRFLYSNAEITKRRDPVGVNDIRDLVLHIIADAPPPSWIRVQNSHTIQKLVVLLVPGLTSTVLSLPPLPTSATENPNLPIAIPLPPSPFPHTPSSPPDLPSSVDPRSEEAAALYGGIPFITRTFSHACPTRAPGDANRMHSVLNTFFQAPVSSEERKRRLRERVAAERSAKKDPTQYLLTVEQMIENDYPVPSYLADVFSKPDGWIETPEVDPEVDTKPGAQSVYAIDCEMCLTEEGKALTRVCIIDFITNEVIKDQLVKPPSPITDYLTRFSGITAEALEPVTTTLADVQAHLRKLITPSTILLGHSLESDLRALQLSHSRCIDTALIFHHPRGRPLKPGLAWLARRWLGRIIQDRGPGGHDPEEDARACVDLLKAKIKNGPAYGEFRTDYEPTLARIARSPSHIRSGGTGGGPRVAIVDLGNPAAWHGTSASAPATTVPCTSDAEVIEGVIGALDSHEFVFARLMTLADALGWVTPKTPADGGASSENPETARNNTIPVEKADRAAVATNPDTVSSPPTVASPDQNQNNNVLFSAVTDLNAQLTTLHAALPPRTAFLLFSGHSDPRSMSALNSRRSQYQTQAGQNQNQVNSSAAGIGAGTGPAGTDVSVPLRWSTGDDRALEEAVVRARMGLLFVGVKT